MFKSNKAADQSGFAINQNSRGRINNRLLVFDFTQNGNSNQCKKCGSDYCQNCHQKIEFIMQEHPQMLKRTGGQNANV